jgi:hypothetical protein
VFQNRVLRRIFVPERYEVTGGWRKLHNEEVPSLYTSPDIIRVTRSRRMRWAGHVAYNSLFGKPEGKRPLVRPKRRLEDNIKMVHSEIRFWVWIAFIWFRIGTGGGLL